MADRKVAEHQIRTAIKAYLDAGGDPEFYVVSKKLVYDAQRNAIDELLAEIHRDETTDVTGYSINKRRVAVLAQKVLDKLKRPQVKIPKGIKFL